MVEGESWEDVREKLYKSEEIRELFRFNLSNVRKTLLSFLSKSDGLKLECVVCGKIFDHELNKDGFTIYDKHGHHEKDISESQWKQLIEENNSIYFKKMEREFGSDILRYDLTLDSKFES